MSFKLGCNWLDRSPGSSRDELDATLAAFRIIVGDQNVTAYVELTDDQRNRATEQAVEKLHIPTYFVAEWIAENWWSLLYEPKKTDIEHDAQYDPRYEARHALTTAKHGFALPDVHIEPSGSAIIIGCRASEDSLAGVKFKNSGTAVMSRKAVRMVLRDFVVFVKRRLDDQSVHGTPLQKAWANIEDTSDDQAVLCTLAGALGVDPYAIDNDAFHAIEAVYDALGEVGALDFCMASSDREILDSRNLIAAVAEKLDGPHLVDFSPLKNVQPVNDNLSHPGYRRGRTTAIRVRDYLGMSATNASGSDKFFETLNLDAESVSIQHSEGAVFNAAIDRDGFCASMVLTPQYVEARRFAACRAVFLALDSGAKSRRISTDTVARDQQASRAFAAEILVPFEYVKAKAKNGRVSRELVSQIAHDTRASAEVVKWQAINNGLVVS